MAKGTWLCSKAVAKVMIEQGSGGKIVNISSILGKVQSALAIGAGGGCTTFRFVHKLPHHLVPVSGSIFPHAFKLRRDGQVSVPRSRQDTSLGSRRRGSAPSSTAWWTSSRSSHHSARSPTGSSQRSPGETWARLLKYHLAWPRRSTWTCSQRVQSGQGGSPRQCAAPGSRPQSAGEEWLGISSGRPFLSR